MANFDELKRSFYTDSRDLEIDLPKPLGDLTIPNRVQGGQIIITKYVDRLKTRSHELSNYL